MGKGAAVSNWFSSYGYVILGSIAIGLGGVLVTLGWNNKSAQQEKRSLIRAVCREWWLNNYWVQKWPLRDSKDPNEIPLRGAPYNPFVIHAVAAAKTSPLLGKSRADSGIPLLLANYEMLALHCNTLFDDENDKLGKIGHLLGKEEVLRRLKDTRETPPYTKFKQFHAEVAIFLASNYRSILKMAGEELFPDSYVVVTETKRDEGGATFDIHVAAKRFEPSVPDQVTEPLPDNSEAKARDEEQEESP